MAAIHPTTRELTAKVVYYGPALGGKTTNLRSIYESIPVAGRGKLLSLATETDRTIFFDFLPIGLGNFRGMKIRVQLYTVPGQVCYDETRKLVLRGVDGVVFVADSQEDRFEANVESFRNLQTNLAAHGLELADMPHVLQLNKQDLGSLTPVELLNAELNPHKVPFHTSVAIDGVGVEQTLKDIVRAVLTDLATKYDLDIRAVM